MDTGSVLLRGRRAARKRTAELTYDCAHRKRAVNGGGMRVGTAAAPGFPAGDRPFGFPAPHRKSRPVPPADRVTDPLPEYPWEDDE
jgi:hypothetical protein